MDDAVQHVGKASMELGITVMGGTVSTAARMAELAERNEFGSAWTAEFYDRSASISLAAMAARTSRIRLGSAIMYAFGRSPLVLAIEARDLDEMSGGRMTIGLGTGTRGQVAGWLGLSPDHLAPRVEELVPLLRRLWRLHEGPIRHQGRFYQLDIYPTAKLRPLHNDIPIYLAGTNPRMIEAAGAVADGLVGHPVFTPEYVIEVVRPALARGAQRGGRSREIPVAGYIVCSIADDLEQARQEAAAQLAFYACVKTFDAILIRQHGFLDEVQAIRDAFKRHDVRGMNAAVSERMLDALCIYGTAAEARQRFRARYAGLYEQPLLFSPSVGMSRERQWENIMAIIETFHPATVPAGGSRLAEAVAESGRPR